MRHSSSVPRVPVLFGLILVLVSAAPARAAGQPHAFHVDVVGNGQPMILIPGLASSGDTWKTTVERYRSRYTCYVLTLAGFAGQPPIVEPLFAAARAELAGYIRDNHLDHPTIVGHSLGGTLALALAADHPDLVGPLVIVDALPFLAGAQFSAKTAAEAQPPSAALRAYMTAMTRPQYEQYVETGAATRFMVTSEADHETVKGWSMTSDANTVGNAMADLYVTDLRSAIASIRTPVLVLGTWAGLSDQGKSFGASISRAAVVDQFEQQFANLPQLHFALAEHARHFVMFDDPMWFFAQLDAFLAHPAAATGDRGFAGDKRGVR